jgi:uncharacterized protein (DUF1919 family)
MKTITILLLISFISCTNIDSYNHESPELLSVDSLISMIDEKNVSIKESEDSLIEIIDSLHIKPKVIIVEKPIKSKPIVEKSVVLIRDTIRDTIPITQNPEIIILIDTIKDTIYLNKRLLKKIN